MGLTRDRRVCVDRRRHDPRASEETDVGIQYAREGRAEVRRELAD